MNEKRLKELMKNVGYDHPEHDELEKKTRLFLDRECNRIPADLVMQAKQDFPVCRPSTGALAVNFEEEIAEEFPELIRDYDEASESEEFYGTFAEYLGEFHAEHYGIQDFFDRNYVFHDCETYPQCEFFFEARTPSLEEWLLESVDLLHEISVTVVEADMNGTYRAGFFPRGAQAYEGSLIPLMRLFTGRYDREEWK